MTKEMDNFEIHSEQGIAAALEAKRLAEKYNKDFLDCKDLVSIYRRWQKQYPTAYEQ